MKIETVTVTQNGFGRHAQALDSTQLNFDAIAFFARKNIHDIEKNGEQADGECTKKKHGESGFNWFLSVGLWDGLKRPLLAGCSITALSLEPHVHDPFQTFARTRPLLPVIRFDDRW